MLHASMFKMATTTNLCQTKSDDATCGGKQHQDEYFVFVSICFTHK